MLEINNRYVRVAPDNQETIVSIKTEEEAKYHTELLEHGYKYTKVIVHERPVECESCHA